MPMAPVHDIPEQCSGYGSTRLELQRSIHRMRGVLYDAYCLIYVHLQLTLMFTSELTEAVNHVQNVLDTYCPADKGR